MDDIKFQIVLWVVFGLLISAIISAGEISRNWRAYRRHRWLRKKQFERQKRLECIRVECQEITAARKSSGEKHITGYKYAMIGWYNGKLCFRPIHNSVVTSYQAVDEAVCFRGLLDSGINVPVGSEQELVLYREFLTATKDVGHMPDPLPHDINQDSNHHCGFYAAMSRAHLSIIPRSEPWSWNKHFAVVLTVDLSGKVFVHEYSYRAAKQEVLRVTVPHMCRYHDEVGSCDDRASHMACFVTATVRVDSNYEQYLYPSLMPVCEAHAKLACESGRAVYTLVDIASELRTEVLWDNQQPSEH